MAFQGDPPRYAFRVDWYDSHAALTRNYDLFYHMNDGTVEMNDIKLRKMFLRRTKVDGITLDKLYPGNTITILGRTLHVKGFADDFTASQLRCRMESSVILFFCSQKKHLGEALNVLGKNCLNISQMKMCFLSNAELNEIRKSSSEVKESEVIAIAVIGECAVDKCKALCDPEASPESLSDSPNSFSARYGKQVAACATDAEQCQVLTKFFFDPCRENTATFDSSTLCLIKPHAVENGCVGAIIEKICDAHFDITAAATFKMSRAEAEEFLEVYKGVVYEYQEMVEQLFSGMVIALELRAQDAQPKFREFCGPAEPAIGKQLRPHTLRALFGETKVQNAVHCTDLPEDAQLELEYFFKILPKCQMY